MFERYTEKARRVIFFARYEASVYGSPYIETEHLLLGLAREDQPLLRLFLGDRDIRSEIEQHIARRERVPTHIEIPLTAECKKALNLASEEAQRLAHRHVDTQHVLLGMMRVDGSLAAQLLQAAGLRAEAIREKVSRDFRGTVTTAGRLHAGGMPTLENFVAGLKSSSSQEVTEFFAPRSRFIDAEGGHWTREEVFKKGEELFAHYAKKNSDAVIEPALIDTDNLFVASVVWKNAMFASERRAWVHRMSVVMIRENEEWRILLMQVTPAFGEQNGSPLSVKRDPPG
ncbi:MAG: ATP-dependent Clp protease ATP-binding subunit [Acidobacteria bacterium]|nr:ATP-dependent Clp protease ATP-binding subunit [Acidobacteriota bacterium]